MLAWFLSVSLWLAREKGREVGVKRERDSEFLKNNIITRKVFSTKTKTVRTPF